jgi:glycosyltransferase involved in cell wall biosynthesis
VTVRVLHVVDTKQLRGAEVFASDLIRALNEANVSQSVGVLRDSGSGRVEFEAPEQRLGSGGWMAPGLRIRPRALRALQRLISEWQPDIVQAHGGSTLKYTIPAVIARRARVVYRQIGPTAPEMMGRLRTVGNGFLMRRADRVVAVGEAVRTNVVEVFAVPRERVVRISNAVDPRRIMTTRSREATRRALGILPDSPVILSLGALTWEKDPLAHVQIGDRVLRERPEAVHIVVGDGPMRLEVESAIRNRGLEDRVLMLGARDNVADFFAASDVLLFASRTDGMESMNASVIEAGMLGVPAAAYAVGGVPEVVVDRVTGRLTRPGDLDGLAACVLEMVADPEGSRALGEAARERYRSLFDMAMIAPKYLHLYEEILAS